MLHFNQSRMIEQATFTCSPLRKALEKQAKTVQGRKQVEALKVLKPDVQQLGIRDVILEDCLNEEGKNHIYNSTISSKIFC